MSATPINTALLSAFVTVADKRSFSKAADTLGVTKSTVSRAIARLERDLGAELIHRTTHKIALSTAGTALYERTAPLLAALGAAVGDMPERAEQPSGELRMTAPYDFGVLVLPEMLFQFALRYPEIRFDVRLTNTKIDLVAEGFDLAIRVSPTNLADSSLSVRRLSGGEMRVYASPSYVARRGEPRSFGEAGHDWVVFSAPSPMRAPRNFCPRFRSDDCFVARELIKYGAGVGALPTHVAMRDLSAGTLVEVAPSVRLRGTGAGGYFMLYPSSGQVPRKVSAFRDFAIQHLKFHPLDSGSGRVR